jgi:hypothetical protein
MLYHSLPRGLPLVLICTLSACNTVSEDRMSTSGSNLSSDYERLASTANETSGLGGVALKLQPIPTATTLSSSSGTLDHTTGATTINDGTYTLVDPDGFTADGLLTDGVSPCFQRQRRGLRATMITHASTHMLISSTLYPSYQPEFMAS